MDVLEISLLVVPVVIGLLLNVVWRRLIRRLNTVSSRGDNIKGPGRLPHDESNSKRMLLFLLTLQYRRVGDREIRVYGDIALAAIVLWFAYILSMLIIYSGRTIDGTTLFH